MENKVFSPNVALNAVTVTMPRPMSEGLLVARRVISETTVSFWDMMFSWYTFARARDVLQAAWEAPFYVIPLAAEYEDLPSIATSPGSEDELPIPDWPFAYAASEMNPIAFVRASIKEGNIVSWCPGFRIATHSTMLEDMLLDGQRVMTAHVLTRFMGFDPQLGTWRRVELFCHFNVSSYGEGQLGRRASTFRRIDQWDISSRRKGPSQYQEENKAKALKCAEEDENFPLIEWIQSNAPPFSGEQVRQICDLVGFVASEQEVVSRQWEERGRDVEAGSFIIHLPPILTATFNAALTASSEPQTWLLCNEQVLIEEKASESLVALRSMNEVVSRGAVDRIVPQLQEACSLLEGSEEEWEEILRLAYKFTTEMEAHHTA